MQLSKAAKAGLCLTLAFTPGLSAAEVLAAEPEETEEESLSPQPSGTPEATPVSDTLSNEKTIPEQKDDPVPAQNEAVKQEGLSASAQKNEADQALENNPDEHPATGLSDTEAVSSEDPLDSTDSGLTASGSQGHTGALSQDPDLAEEQPDLAAEKSAEPDNQDGLSENQIPNPDSQPKTGDADKDNVSHTDNPNDSNPDKTDPDNPDEPEPGDTGQDDPGSDDTDPDEPGRQTLTPEEIKAKNEEIDRTNAELKRKYEQELEQYQKDCRKYANVVKIDQSSDGKLTLIGKTGEPGVGYYDDISLLVTQDYPELKDVIWTQGIQWNDDTEILGDKDFLIQVKTKEGDITTLEGDKGKVRISGAPNIFALDTKTYTAAGNTCYYDLTKVCQNSKAVTFTNVTTDSNDRKIDMVVRFSPFTMLPGAASISPDAQNLLMMFKAPDKSFEFNMNGTTVTQLNLSDISFVYHDDKERNMLNVGLVMIASDIDGAQSFKTDMGNQIIYLDPDSNITRNGDCFKMINLNKKYNCDGMNSSPLGTAVLAGTGEHFFYTYDQETVENAKSNATDEDDWDWGDNCYARGFWLNLFGNTTTMDIHSKPLPPQYLDRIPEPKKPDDPEPTPPTPDKPEPHHPTLNKPAPHQPAPDQPKPDKPEPEKPSTDEPRKSTPEAVSSGEYTAGTIAFASPVHYLNQKTEPTAPAKAAALAPVTKAAHPNTALGTYTFMDLALAGLAALAGGLSLSHLFKTKDKE